MNYTVKYSLFCLSIAIFLLGCDEDPRCNDGVWNGDETAIDCGGNCDPCFSCNDGILNQGEFDVDCGGPCPNTCEGQKEWEVLDFPVVNVKNIHFFNDDEGILMAEESIWHTTDQGDSWKLVNTPAGIYEFQWMRIVNDELAFVLVGQQNAAHRLYKVTGKFSNWSEFGLNLPTEDADYRSIFDIAAVDENDILVAHEKIFGVIQLTRTRDGGQTWEVLFDSADFYAANVDYISSLQYGFGSTIYAFREREQISSTDDGASWEIKDLPSDFRIDDFKHLATESGFLRFQDANTGYYQRGGSSVINYTSNGGLSWQPLDEPAVLSPGSFWRVTDYTILADGRQLYTTQQSCDEQNIGFCSIAWLSDTSGNNWSRLGITPGYDNSAFEEIMAVDPIYFPEVTYAVDGSAWNENRKFLRLR